MTDGQRESDLEEARIRAWRLALIQSLGPTLRESIRLSFDSQVATLKRILGIMRACHQPAPMIEGARQYWLYLSGCGEEYGVREIEGYQEED